MKKLRLLFFVAGISFCMLASGQVPQMIDYQGMARDGSGNPIANMVISLRMSVWQGPMPGTMVYQEKHTPLTNSYGLFNLMIGDGNVLSGNFAAINWPHGNFWVQTEIDPSGGNSFTDMGMSKLATVPFAFYAGSSGGGGSSPWLSNGPDIYFNSGFVGIGTDSPAERLHVHAPGTDNYAYLTGDGLAYWSVDVPGNSGLNLREGGADVAWLYWNPFSQAIFMYESGNQTQSWKNNNSGFGTLDPLVKVQSIEEGSPGVMGSDLNLLYSPTQALAPALFGWSENNTSDITYGLLGHAYSTTSMYNNGVFGEGGGGTNNNYGGYFVGYGDVGSTYSISVYGDDMGAATNNYAGYFSGDVYVSGNLGKASGSFKIDHPQDPANKFLVHSFVESPDMMNIYNGNVVTGSDGIALVKLPSYFDAVNVDFRYQLTVIGEFAQAIVKEEISGNAFTIQTDKPNIKVSWQVTGVRNDPYAQQHRIVPEVDKPAHEKGLYLHPELYGKSSDMRFKTGMQHAERASYTGTPVTVKDPRTEPVQK